MCGWVLKIQNVDLISLTYYICGFPEQAIFIKQHLLWDLERVIFLHFKFWFEKELTN
jgi:hypothetical protein